MKFKLKIIQWFANPEQFENSFEWLIIAVFILHKRVENSLSEDSKLTTSLCKRNTAIIHLWNEFSNCSGLVIHCTWIFLINEFWLFYKELLKWSTIDELLQDLVNDGAVNGSSFNGVDRTPPLNLLKVHPKCVENDC
jgi:hypothetical protein